MAGKYIVARRWAIHNYRQTEGGKKTAREAAARYRAAHPDRILAIRKVRIAIRQGKLVRPEVCPDCGVKGKIEAHHPDYSRPLEVKWQCNKCHNLSHGRH